MCRGLLMTDVWIWSVSDSIIGKADGAYIGHALMTFISSMWHGA
jgi:hypothetical protein